MKNEKNWFKLTIDMATGKCKMVHKLWDFKGNMMDIFGFKNNIGYSSNETYNDFRKEDYKLKE